MDVLFVASECAPLVKTGGLADVVGSLPKALTAEGINARVLLPAYGGLAGSGKPDESAEVAGLGGVGATVGAVRMHGLDLLLLDAPGYFDRPGNPYLGPDGTDWRDNDLRFGTLSAAAADIARRGFNGWRPDIVHLHDWQAGLTAAYLALGDGPAPPVITTVHNIAFQGLFPPTGIMALRLPPEAFHPDGYEFHDKVGFLKAGLVYADRVTTVSPTYAAELMTPEFGMGLEGVIAARRADLVGIVNGVDTDVWDPATDPALAATYTARALRGKAVNRTALLEEFGLTDTDGPLICVISRLTRQKGLDLLLDAVPDLVAAGARLSVLGTGDPDLEAGFERAAGEHPQAVGARIGFDETLAHRMQAGADAIVVPSRFEPCGLTQLHGLRYGTLPVVARTGGLNDTVIDANDAALAAGVATGFQFEPDSAAALAHALHRVVSAYADRSGWRAMVRRAMAHPVDWGRSARAYADLYREVAANAAAVRG